MKLAQYNSLSQFSELLRNPNGASIGISHLAFVRYFGTSNAGAEMNANNNLQNFHNTIGNLSVEINHSNEVETVSSYN